jgi:DNA-binding NarL/FixJ family response regulator
MKRIAVSVDVQTQHVRDLILACLAENKVFEPSLGSPVDSHFYIREIGGRVQDALAELADLRAHNPALEICLTSATSDANTLLCCMDAGIRYFLPQPMHPKDIRGVLKRYLDRQSSEPTAARKP